MGVTIRSGLPDDLRGQAAALYWQAFGGKLGRVLGPGARALAYFNRVIRLDHCVAALDEGGRLVGVAGFKTPSGSFVGGRWSDLAAVYGPLGGCWRWFLWWAISREVDNDRFLVDGICVDPAWRGRGVGGALLAALCREGTARGYCSIRLDVVAENPRARALYERYGFQPLHTHRLGPIRYLFGFSAATTMTRVLE